MTNSSSLHLPNAVAGKYGLSITLYNGDQRIDCSSKSIPEAIKRPIGMLAEACYDAYLAAEKARASNTVDNSFFVSSIMKKRGDNGQVERVTSKGETCQTALKAIQLSAEWQKRFDDQWGEKIQTVDQAMGFMLQLFNGQNVQWLNAPPIQAPKVDPTGDKTKTEKTPESDKPDKSKPAPKKKEVEKEEDESLDFSDADASSSGPLGFAPGPIPEGDDAAIPSQRTIFFPGVGNTALADLTDDQSRAKRGCIHFMKQKFKLRGQTLLANDLVAPPNRGSLRYQVLKHTFQSLVEKLKNNDRNLNTDEKTLLVVLQGYHHHLLENIKYPWATALKEAQEKYNRTFDANKSLPHFKKAYDIKADDDAEGYYKFFVKQHIWTRMRSNFNADLQDGPAVIAVISDPADYLALIQG
ncbi:MAG TPA: hypothetical protein VLG44_01440 [Chlamydiales bacterium]|nr:hypothetical protein [Chlamydiales bacterium]